MKIVFAFAFVALTAAVPLPDAGIPAPVHLPEPDVPQFVQAAEPGFAAISIQPLFIAPEVAAEFYKSFEVNPPLGDVHELAYGLPVEEFQAEPVNFVDSPANENPGEPINFVDIAEAPIAYDNFEQAVQEIQPGTVNFVDSIPPLLPRGPLNIADLAAAAVATIDVVPEPVNFVDVAVNAEAATFNHENSEVVAEEIQPEPVNFVDSLPVEVIPGEPVNFVDVAENAPFHHEIAELNPLEIQPEPVNFVDSHIPFNYDTDMASMLR